MKIINQSGYTAEERAAHASIVQSNAVTSMQMLLDGLDKCHVAKPADLAALHAQFAAEFAESERLTPESGLLVGRLWAHAAVQQARAQPPSPPAQQLPHSPTAPQQPHSPQRSTSQTPCSPMQPPKSALTATPTEASHPP